MFASKTPPVPVDPIYKTIGGLIKAKRKALEMKQEHLAGDLGISRGSLANIETGKQSILVHQLYRFAEKLKFAPADLLPPAPAELLDVDQTDLPLPSDLKGKQKEQVARLFMMDHINPKPSTKVLHAKTRKGR
jgi:transcriptional regulator with XRE-family HTH domain